MVKRKTIQGQDSWLYIGRLKIGRLDVPTHKHDLVSYDLLVIIRKNLVWAHFKYGTVLVEPTLVECTSL